ncbi:MAG: AraC family transcriptional regulator [Clostridia bacterium]|nr:AraC family transcriptional regulator [Clostridia bacterium]
MLRKSRTYYKYLLSYVALLMAATLVLVVFSQAFFIVQLKENLTETHRSRLRQLVQQLDDDISQVYTIDYQISSVNENFLSYYLSEPGPMRDLRIVNELHNLLAPSTFIAEMALVERGATDVYTSSAVYARELFFSGIFSFDAWSDPVGDLSALRGRIVRPAERVNGSERYITFINAASVFSRLQNTVQLYFVKESHFLSLLSPAESPSQQGAIWDADGRIIVSTLALEGPVGAGNVRIGGTEYHVLLEASAVTDWTYAMLLPTDEFFAPIHRAQVTLLVFLAALIAAGTLVIHYAMKVNYRPLRELTEQLGAATGDELSSLRDVIGSLAEQNESMRAQLMCSPDGQALRDTLLFALLKGKFTSLEAFNQEAAPLNMRFDSPCYQVLMLRHFASGDAGEAEIPRPLLQTAFADALGPDFTFHFRELFEPSTIVCLVGCSPEKAADLPGRCLTLLDILAQQHGLAFTIGMSDMRDDVGQMTAACFEATQAVREHFIRGRHQLIRYSELDKTLTAAGPDVSASNPLNELRALSTMTRPQQREALQRFVMRLKAESVPSLLAKSYCNSAVQALMAACGGAVNMDDLFTISYLRTADDYLAFMLHLLEEDAEAAMPHAAADPGAQTPVPELLGRIYACVAERFDDCNFSIQEVADALSLSGSYLSQYFKQQTGDTLTAHVAALRIRKACTLLETTAMPLQMISESVGYYNQNSFIRRFKQITGMTPGEYRRGHQ